MLVGYPSEAFGARIDARAALDDMLVRHARGLPVDVDQLVAAIEELRPFRSRNTGKTKRLKSEVARLTDRNGELALQNYDLRATVRVLTAELATTQKEPA